MKLIQKFEIEYLEDAIAFLESLPAGVRGKITYNVQKCMYYNDAELFKKK